MDARYKSYLQAISSQKKSMVDTLKLWSGQNSYSDNVEGLLRMAALLEERFTPLGGTHKRIAIPPRLKLDRSGAISRVPQGEALQIVKRPKAPVRLLLAGHMDTVFSPEAPFQTAAVKGSRIKGPGVADMKGGLLIMLHALHALESSPWKEKVGWEVVITPDEETGSCGGEKLYRRAAPKAHAALLFEPSFPDGQMVSARKGSCNIAVTVSGKSAHVGRDFAAGRNAVTALSRWLLNVEQLTDLSKGITVNIGRVEGGEAFNIVPDRAVAQVNVRTDTPEDAAIIDECIQLLCDESNSQEGIRLTKHTIAARGPKPLDEGTNKLFGLFKECGRELDMPLKWRPTGGVCDGNIIAESGVPTLDTLGAIGGGLHTYDEYADIDSLPERSCLTALFLLKLAAGEIALPGKEARP